MANLIQLLQNVLETKDPLLANETKRILLKEALQALVLDYLYNHRQYRTLNFYGGTCLHVVYGLNRLSEDIDLDNGQGLDVERLPGDLLTYVGGVLDYRAASVRRQIGRQGILRITLRFPVLQELGLSQLQAEALHLKLEISHHRQLAEIRHTPVIAFGRSFVPAHFSVETMMAGKILACLERSFQKGRAARTIKGRDWYDLLWLMQQRIQPLEEKLSMEGNELYDIQSAMLALSERIEKIRPGDLAVDLLPLFEQRVFTENWIAAFHETFRHSVKFYLA